jgi:hypothetical protein
MKIQTLAVSFLENLEVRVKATRRGSLFIDHTLRSQESLSMVVVEIVVVTRVVGGCNRAGLITSRRSVRNNFEGDDGVLGENHLTIVNLFEREDVVAGFSFDDRYV